MYTFVQSNNGKMNYRKEHVIYALMWIALYISPVMGLYMRMSSDPHIDFSWIEILNAWKFNTVWLALFAIHNFILLPILLVKRRAWLYSALSLSLIGAAVAALFLIRPAHNGHNRHWRQSVGMAERHYGLVPKRGARPLFKPPRRPDQRFAGPLPMLGPGEMVAAIGGLLLMGMNLGVKLYFKSQEDSKALVQIERQNLERQLEYLKYQVNPHFFMNTLNNIHALVDIDPERAKTTIVELSKMMRYILYEGNNRLIPLPREVQFLRNYVQLMSLRYTDRVRISLDVPDRVPEKTLPPLLLIIFVENAFKHGISYRTESFIDIAISVADDRLRFRCVNSKPQQPAIDRKKGGMGLVNVRRRLDLLFPKRYEMEIADGDKEYSVNLEIPLAK